MNLILIIVLAAASGWIIGYFVGFKHATKKMWADIKNELEEWYPK